MIIICQRENCKHRKMNNTFQKTYICGKGISWDGSGGLLEIGTTGRCKGFEKKIVRYGDTHPCGEIDPVRD